LIRIRLIPMDQDMDSAHGNAPDAGIHSRKLGARPRIALKRAAFVQSSMVRSGRDLMLLLCLFDSFRRLPMGFAARASIRRMVRDARRAR
jgi:hypothetical protein